MANLNQLLSTQGEPIYESKFVKILQKFAEKFGCFKINRLLCSVQISIGAWKSPQQGGIFYAIDFAGKDISSTAWGSGNTPKAFPIEA